MSKLKNFQMPKKIRLPTLEEYAPLHASTFDLKISGFDALALLGACQLVLRHPLFSKSGVPSNVTRVFAEDLERRIGEVAPNLKELCAAGWKPSEDR